MESRERWRGRKRKRRPERVFGEIEWGGCNRERERRELEGEMRDREKRDETETGGGGCSWYRRERRDGVGRGAVKRSEENGGCIVGCCRRKRCEEKEEEEWRE